MPEPTPAPGTILAEPCGAPMGWPGDDGRPCGRPQGHSAAGGQVHPGHAYHAYADDPPTKPYTRRVYWQVEPAPLEWGYGPNPDAVTLCPSENQARDEAHERREDVWYRPTNPARWTWSLGRVTY